MPIPPLAAISVERHRCSSKISALTKSTGNSTAVMDQVRRFDSTLQKKAAAKYRRGKTQSATLDGAVRKASSSTTTPSARPNCRYQLYYTWIDDTGERVCGDAR